MRTRNRVLCALYVCFLIGLLLVSGIFSIVSIAKQVNTNNPYGINGSYVIYPYGQTAAKPGDKITIQVNTTGSGTTTGTCDASLIGGSATSSINDDGNYASDRDQHANDGIFCNVFTIACQAGYKKVPFTIGTFTGSVTVGVDNNPPNVTQVSVVYPVGQSAAKQGDQVRLLAHLADHAIRKPVDVVMALDNSGSMAGTPVTDLVNAVNTFIDNFASYDRIAVLCFGGPSATPVPRLLVDWSYMTASNKTTAKAQVSTLINDCNYNTPIWDTIYNATWKAMSEHLSKNHPVVVAFTDGANNINNYNVDPWTNWVNPPSTPRGLSNISLDVFTIGLNSGSLTAATQHELEEIAWTSHGPGMFFLLTSSAQLPDIFATITGAILGGAPEGIMRVYYNGTTIGGVNTEPMFDDGLHQDGAANDGWYASDLISVRNKTTDSILINVTAFDVAGNNRTNYTYIKIDNTPPIVQNVTTIYDSNNTMTKDGKFVYFTANVMDIGKVQGIAGLGVTANTTAIGGDAAVAMNDDGLGNDKVKGDGIYTSEKVIVKTGLATGTFGISVTAKDIAYNTFTQYGSVTIDNAKVGITLITPFQDEYIGGMYLVRASVVDNYAVAKVSLEITGPTGTIAVSNLPYDSVNGEYWYILNTSTIPDGNYKIQETVVDIFGNSNTSEEVIFHIDRTPPTITDASNMNSDVKTGDFTLMVNVTDDGCGVGYVQISIDNQPWVNMTKSLNYTYGWTYTWSTDVGNNGVHLIKIRAFDKLGNVAVQDIAHMKVQNKDMNYFVFALFIIASAIILLVLFFFRWFSQRPKVVRLKPMQPAQQIVVEQPPPQPMTGPAPPPPPGFAEQPPQ